jgi:hypothetical protein
LQPTGNPWDKAAGPLFLTIDRLIFLDDAKSRLDAPSASRTKTTCEWNLVP